MMYYLELLVNDCKYAQFRRKSLVNLLHYVSEADQTWSCHALHAQPLPDRLFQHFRRCPRCFKVNKLGHFKARGRIKNSIIPTEDLVEYI